MNKRSYDYEFSYVRWPRQIVKCLREQKIYTYIRIEYLFCSPLKSLKKRPNVPSIHPSSRSSCIPDRIRHWKPDFLITRFVSVHPNARFPFGFQSTVQLVRVTLSLRVCDPPQCRVVPAPKLPFRRKGPGSLKQSPE